MLKRSINPYWRTDMEAAIKAEELREKALSDKIDFTFETVLSTDRNINLLKRAKENGYFIRGMLYYRNMILYRIELSGLRVVR